MLYFFVQVEQQVSDDELSLIGWYELSGACGEDGFNETPPALQSMALGTQAASYTVPLHHILQDRVHLLQQKESSKWHNMNITYYPTQKSIQDSVR